MAARTRPVARRWRGPRRGEPVWDASTRQEFASRGPSTMLVAPAVATAAPVARGWRAGRGSASNLRHAAPKTATAAAMETLASMAPPRRHAARRARNVLHVHPGAPVTAVLVRCPARCPAEDAARPTDAASSPTSRTRTLVAWTAVRCALREPSVSRGPAFRVRARRVATVAAMATRASRERRQRRADPVARRVRRAATT